jgi:hypothetical protein
MADVKHCTASPINYFVKLVDRGECKLIGTCLTMFGRQIVEFLHKRTRQICSLLAFGELASGGFFHYVQLTGLLRHPSNKIL